jgi:hypothetical protein
MSAWRSWREMEAIDAPAINHGEMCVPSSAASDWADEKGTSSTTRPSGKGCGS